MEMLRMIGFLLIGIRSGECIMECMSCNEAKTVDECIGTTVTCGPGEECFFDKETTETLRVVYNAGCRSTTVCEIMRQLGSGVGRKKRLVNCAECCSTPQGARVPCNARLCGANPHVEMRDECLVCTSGVASVNACQNREVCQDTEMCSTSITWEGVLRYYFTCERKQVCERFISAGASASSTHNGRRAGGIAICSACCTGNRCNQEDCFQLRKNMTSALLGTILPSTVPSG